MQLPLSLASTHLRIGSGGTRKIVESALPTKGRGESVLRPLRCIRTASVNFVQQGLVTSEIRFEF